MGPQTHWRSDYKWRNTTAIKGSTPGRGNWWRQPEITSSLASFTSHLRSEANIHPGAQLTNSLGTFFPESTFGIRHSHPMSPPNYIHRIGHQIILTICKSQIYLPKGQGKRIWHRPWKGFQRKISKVFGAVATLRDYVITY